MSRRIRGTIALGVVAGVATSLTVAPTASAEPSPFVQHEVVASGLNNPRQIDQGWGGALLVAEAGRGGSTCQGEGADRLCFGATGSVTRITGLNQTRPTATRIVTGLVSAAITDDGSFASGATGVEDNTRGEVLVAMNGLLPPLPGLPDHIAALLRAVPRTPPLSTRLTKVADVAAIEMATNPDGYIRPGRGPELASNPYGVLALDDGRTIVADAAGNTLIQVQPDGETSVLAILPQHGEDGSRHATPTALTLGGDGYLYVADLAHEERGEARIWKLTQSGEIVGWIGAGEGAAVQTDRGLTTLVGIDVARNGDIYVTELLDGDSPDLPPGRLVRIDADTGRTSSVAVPFPGGVTFGKDQQLYVVAFGVATSDGMGYPGSDGQVWRVPLSAFPAG
jgi:sugar lactone lactonase YvrE